MPVLAEKSKETTAERSAELLHVLSKTEYSIQSLPESDEEQAKKRLAVLGELMEESGIMCAVLEADKRQHDDARCELDALCNGESYAKFRHGGLFPLLGQEVPRRWGELGLAL